MSALPAKYNMTLWMGATFTARISWFDADANRPHDLTGCAATLTIRNPQDHSVLAVLEDGQGLILGNVNGTIDIELAAAVTDALTWRTGVYELLVTQPDSRVDPLLWGSIAVKGI